MSTKQRSPLFSGYGVLSRGGTRGFTLAELAVVLVIVGLLLGGLMVPLTAQVDIRAQNDMEKLFSDIRETLLGYALTHTATDGKPYLPCPDTDDDGAENRVATPGACASQEGRLPWATLGMTAVENWGNRVRYRVDSNFSNSSTGFSLSHTGTISVCATGTGPCTGTDLLANSLPAVFLSHGKNGAGAFNAAGGINAVSTDADELENSDSDTKFVSKSPVANAYDDMTDWLPPGILFNRLVAAGKLP